MTVDDNRDVGNNYYLRPSVTMFVMTMTVIASVARKIETRRWPAIMSMFAYPPLAVMLWCNTHRRRRATVAIVSISVTIVVSISLLTVLASSVTAPILITLAACV